MRPQFSSLGAAHLVQLLCSVLGTIIVFRSLPLDDIGRVVILVTLNTLVIAPVCLAFSKIYSALLVEENPDLDPDHFYSIASAIIILLSIIPAIACALLYGDPIYVLISIILACFTSNKLNLRHAENDGKFKRIALTRIAVGVAVLGVKVLAAVLLNPYIFAASFALEQFLYKTVLPVNTSTTGISLLLSKPAIIKSERIVAVLKLLPTEFAAGLSSRYPVVLFAVLNLPDLVALYNAAVRLPDAYSSLMFALFAAVRPNAYRETRNTALGDFPFESTKNFFKQTFWLTLAAMIVTPFVLPILFGEVYRPAQVGTGIYFLMGFMMVLGQIQEVWLVSNKMFRVSAYRAFLGACSCVIACTALYFSFGLNGAIMGVAISAVIQFMISNLLFDKTRHIFSRQIDLFRYALSPRSSARF